MDNQKLLQLLKSLSMTPGVDYTVWREKVLGQVNPLFPVTGVREREREICRGKKDNL